MTIVRPQMPPGHPAIIDCHGRVFSDTLFASECKPIEPHRVRFKMTPVVIALALLIIFIPFASAEMPGARAHQVTVDPRVVFDEPKDGQQFSPGDTVSITLRALPPLKDKATDAMISVAGFGMLPSPRFVWPSGVFHWNFTIPNEFVGTLAIEPIIVAGEDASHPGQPKLVNGKLVTIKVQSRDAPNSISLLEHDYVVSWPPCCGPQTQHLYVKGRYGRVERDITVAEAGTVYHTSNPVVADVDANGSVRILGPGVATIMVDNHGAKDTASFVVEDPAHPLPVQDMTAHVRFSKSAAFRDPGAKAYGTYPLIAQTVSVRNKSDQPLPGPLYLMVSGMPDSVQLWGKAHNVPANPPPDMVLYFRYQTPGGKSAALRLTPKNGLSLVPGEEIRQQLYFLPSGSRMTLPDVHLSLVRSGTEP